MSRRGATLALPEGGTCDELAGFVMARRDRVTGTLIVVIDDRTGQWTSDSVERSQWNPEPQPWLTLCLDHATICSHTTRRLAVSHAHEPTGWCEPCAEGASK